MKSGPHWKKYYRETPLDKIPWNKTQADYFQKLLNSKKLGSGKALDLGCGVGIKSITLAKRGFRVTGVDIAPTAIKHAKNKARKAGVKINFIAADATNLSFLRDEKFDLVLDWANIHGLLKARRKKYAQGIAEHTKKGSKFLLRCFSKHEVNKEFTCRLGGRIYLFSQKNIKDLFGKHFKILETNRSKLLSQNPPGKWFDEYLMERL